MCEAVRPPLMEKVAGDRRVPMVTQGTVSWCGEPGQVEGMAVDRCVPTHLLSQSTTPPLPVAMFEE